MTNAALRHSLEHLKASCLSTGVAVDDDVLAGLGGEEAITIHEYATTGGIPFWVGNVAINAPFDDWYTTDADVTLKQANGQIVARHGDEEFVVDRVEALPSYLGRHLPDGQRVDNLVMSHIDRARVSPIKGCVYNCHFCDLGELTYERRPLEDLVAALDVALADENLPPRHVLISGGTPGRAHEQWFEETCVGLIEHSPLPVDVMMAPSERGPALVDALVDAGVEGLSINIELFSQLPSAQLIAGKHKFARPFFEETIARAVERLGRTGAVRSLIIPGLEADEATLEGIEYLASLGCDPVISPFRPAPSTKLATHPPTSSISLLKILERAREIVTRHGVALGPRCPACQHNTLTFPWDVRSPGE